MIDKLSFKQALYDFPAGRCRNDYNDGTHELSTFSDYSCNTFKTCVNDNIILFEFYTTTVDIFLNNVLILTLKYDTYTNIKQLSVSTDVDVKFQINTLYSDEEIFYTELIMMINNFFDLYDEY